MMTYREALKHGPDNPGPKCETWVKGYPWWTTSMKEFMAAQDAISKSYGSRFTCLCEMKEHYAMRYVYGDHKVWGRAKMRVLIGKRGTPYFLVVVNGGHWIKGGNDTMRRWLRFADEYTLESARDLLCEVYPGAVDNIDLLPSMAWYPDPDHVREFLVRKGKGLAYNSPVHALTEQFNHHLTQDELTLQRMMMKMVLPKERVDEIPPNFFKFTEDEYRRVLTGALEGIMVSRATALSRGLGIEQAELFDSQGA